MSERRFWFVIDKGELDYVQDNVTKERITVTELEDLLNQLSDENEQLRNDCSILVQSNQEYRKENEQLRQTISNLKQEPTNKDWDLLVQKCAELSQKNVELWEKIGELQKCKKDSPTKMENTMTKNKN